MVLVGNNNGTIGITVVDATLGPGTKAYQI